MKKIIILLAVFLVIGITSFIFLPEFLLKRTIVEFAEELFQTGVDIDKVELDYSKNTLTMYNIAFANPPGFSLAPALTIGNIDIKFNQDSESLFDSRTIDISEVQIDTVKANIEYNAQGYNFHILYKKYGQTYKTPMLQEEGEELRPLAIVKIDNLYAKNLKATVSRGGLTPISKSKQIKEIELSDIHMEDIGKRFDLSIADVITDVILNGSQKLPHQYRTNKYKSLLH